MSIEPHESQTASPQTEPHIRLRLTIVPAGPFRYLAKIVELGPPEIEYISAQRSTKAECRALARYAAKLLGAEEMEELDLTRSS